MNFPKKKNKTFFKSSGKVETEEINKLIGLRKKLSELNADDIKKFVDIPLSYKTRKGLSENNFIEPTKVQRQTLVHSLQGLDVVAAAKTGSGKTLAFVIPILELLYLKRWTSIDGLGVLIITPTRELAYQIYEVINKVGKRHSFSVGLVIGGKDLKNEWNRINLCNILICTPGRLLHHMNENPAFVCDNLQLLVLDEADQCLSMGFAETMNAVLEEMPSERQTLLFSATQTREVKDLIRAGCKNPIFCSVHEYSKTVTPKNLNESYLVCDDSEKLNYLWSFLKYHKRKKILVFLATCKQVKFINELLCHLKPGLTVLALHGELNQIKRMAIYDKFCSKANAVLIATDVASRGLDIPSVDWVVQLDCPEDVTTYIHRAGRTARHASCGDSLLVLTASQEEAMLENLKAKNINVQRIDIDPNKLLSIQQKAKFALDKYFNLKDQAERAFKAYLKNLAYMKDKRVFKVSSVNLEALAKSFGLDSKPRVRFLERKQKLESQKGSKEETENQNTKSKKTYDLGINSDESDDDFLVPAETQHVKESDNPEELLKDPTLFSKSSADYISKYTIARKVMKNKISLNKKIVFDDDGEPVNGPEVTKPGKLIVSEGQGTGLDISEMKEILKSNDQIDKKLASHRRKEKLRKEKEKLKARKKKSEEDNIENVEGENLNNEEDYSAEESDVDSVANDIIDDLPDPDKVYAKSEENPASENESGISSGDKNDDSSEDEDDDVDDRTTRNRKREFRGKRLAKEAARASKRARFAAENSLDAISFKEKEDLTLFLLKGKKL